MSTSAQYRPQNNKPKYGVLSAVHTDFSFEMLNSKVGFPPFQRLSFRGLCSDPHIRSNVKVILGSIVLTIVGTSEFCRQFWVPASRLHEHGAVPLLIQIKLCFSVLLVVGTMVMFRPDEGESITTCHSMRPSFSAASELCHPFPFSRPISRCAFQRLGTEHDRIRNRFSAYGSVVARELCATLLRRNAVEGCGGFSDG